MESIKLKDIANIQIGNLLSRMEEKDLRKSKIAQLIYLKAFNENAEFTPDAYNTRIVNIKENITENNYIKSGDVLIRLREPFFALSIDKENEGYLFNSVIAVLRAKKEYIPRFIALTINSWDIQRELSILSKGTAIMSISVADIGNIEIKLPNLEKQRDILGLHECLNKEIELAEEIVCLKQRLKKEIFNKVINKEY